MSNFRIGHGYDVHRLVEGRKLILGGVDIPYCKGLDGHSDADVLVHAVMDSILGAMGERDIGYHFPDSDQNLKGVSSMLLLTKVADILDKNCYSVSNIDATIIAQKPKLQPFIADMQSNIAKKLKIQTNIVNIKATTEEGLGFTGNGEGIAAHAVVLLERTK